MSESLRVETAGDNVREALRRNDGLTPPSIEAFMSRATLAAIACAVVGISSAGLAQVGASLPRTLGDSTFALRLALSEVQELVKTGTRPRTLEVDTALENAGHQLRLARNARPRLLPNAHASALWDFTISVQDIRPAGLNKWIAYTTVSLADDPTSTADLALVFTRTDAGWRLFDKREVLATLRTMASRIDAGATTP